MSTTMQVSYEPQAYPWLCLVVLIVSTASQPVFDTTNNNTGNCNYNDDCNSTQICVDAQCVDPCQGVCGSNTVCVVQDEIPLCSCKPEYIGDPFTECTPGECTLNSNCSSDKACFSNQCLDPCQDGCGLNTYCKVINHRPLCACKEGFVFTLDEGCTPTSMPECQTSSHCPQDRACRQQKCVDPCDDAVCGNNTDCFVRNHYPVCACQVGYIGDASNECIPSCSSNEPVQGNKTYFIGTTQKSWFDALDYCYNNGQKLATVNSQAEWNQLTALYNTTISGTSFWLGGNDLERYQEFRWVSNGNFLSFTNWRTNEPQGTPYHCLVVSSDLTWVSQTCTNLYYYACESVTY